MTNQMDGHRQVGMELTNQIVLKSYITDNMQVRVIITN